MKEAAEQKKDLDMFQIPMRGNEGLDPAGDGSDLFGFKSP